MFKLTKSSKLRTLSKRLLTTSIALMSCSLSAVALSMPMDCDKLELKQHHIEVLQKAYELGKPHDLGYTLAAIAYKESHAGSYIINAISQDYGIFQGNVETICKQAGVFTKHFQCNLEIQRVVQDINKAAEHAIETLKYWENYHEKRTESYLVYEKTIRAYNAGFAFDSGDATTYWQEYRMDFHAIKQCVKFDDALAI